jgi:hypothetical protein
VSSYKTIASHFTKSIDDWILQQSDVRKLRPAPLRDIENLLNWHRIHDHKAINKAEHQYLEKKIDLVRLVPENKTNVRRLVDKSPWLSTLSIWREQKEFDIEYDIKSIQSYSEKRLDNFASGIIVTIGAVMLMAPLWIMQFLNSSVSKLVVITVFNSAFLLVMSFIMVAKPFEALGATAAQVSLYTYVILSCLADVLYSYAAVLMVFMQVGGS